MLVSIIPFLWTSIVPLLSSGEGGQTVASETATPTTTTTTQTLQVSPEARLEEVKARLKGQARGYEAILQTEPENQTALLALFETRKELVQLGVADVKETIEPLEKLIRLNPNVIAYQLELGSLYVQQQRSAEARAIYDNAAKIDPQDYRPILAKGIVLQLEGKKDEAKPLFNRATELAPVAFKQQVQAQIEQIETLTSLPKTPPAPSSAPAATPDASTSPNNAPARAVSPAPEAAPGSNTPSPPAAATPNNLTNTPASGNGQPAVPAPAATP